MKRTLADRWNRIRSELTMADLGLDILGKMLVGLGLGTLLADRMRPYAMVVIALGVALSLIVKAKYWKRFWS